MKEINEYILHMHVCYIYIYKLYIYVVIYSNVLHNGGRMHAHSV